MVDLSHVKSYLLSYEWLYKNGGIVGTKMKCLPIPLYSNLWNRSHKISLFFALFYANCVVADVLWATTVLLVLMPLYGVRMEHTKMWKLRVPAKLVLLVTSVTIPWRLLSLTTQQLFVQWATIVPKALDLTTSIHVL